MFMVWRTVVCGDKRRLVIRLFSLYVIFLVCGFVTPMASASNKSIKLIPSQEAGGHSAFVMSAAIPFEASHVITQGMGQLVLNIKGPDMSGGLKRFFSKSLIPSENSCIELIEVDEISDNESSVRFTFNQSVLPGIEVKHSEEDSNYFLTVRLLAYSLSNGSCKALGEGDKKRILKWKERPIFVTGTIQLDTGRPLDNQGIITDDKVGFDEDWEFRRFRIEANGVQLNWRYQLRFDLTNVFSEEGVATEELDIGRAYVSYLGWQPLDLKVGLLYEPYGLEGSTSSKNITFMERAPVGNIMLETNLGVIASYRPSKALYMQLSVFEDQDLVGSSKTDFATTGRISYAPLITQKHVLHLGYSFSKRKLLEPNVRYKIRPESHLAYKVFRTRTLRDVEDIWLSGLEAAYVNGSLSFQAESMNAVHKFQDEKEDQTLSSYYVLGSWFLTGESRRYSRGVFGTVIPNEVVGDGWGAWELALRYSMIDEGRDRTLKDYTLGINWYPHRQFRFMFNWVRAHYEKAEDVGEMDIAQLRGQYSF